MHLRYTQKMASFVSRLRMSHFQKISVFQSSILPNATGCFSVKFYSTISPKMEEAKNRVSSMTEDPGNVAKLKMYALYKQATVGACNTKKPGVFDFVGQAKWTAWNELGQISKEEAEQQYVDLVNSLAGPASEPSGTASTTPDTSSSTVDGLDVSNENGIYTVKLNRPKTLNAITIEMYDGIRDALNNTANDDSVKLLHLTGTGKYYSSGNDLSNFTKIPPEGVKKLAADGRVRCQSFVDAFINYPKPIVCGVNGPAVGIMVTTLGLVDLVYASDSATFQTPFMVLGQSPEGASSYTFPKIMGYAQANEMLLGGRKLTAQEAFGRGLLTDVFPHHEFEQTVDEKLKQLASLPPKSVLYSKALIRDQERETLLKVNEIECLRLEERWLSEECMNAIMSFMSKGSKV